MLVFFVELFLPKPPSHGGIMSRELVTIQHVEEVVARITNPLTAHAAVAALAQDLTDAARYSPQAARALMAQLPRDLQAVVVSSSASELAVPNVAFLPAACVARVLAHDLTLHDHLTAMREAWQLLKEDDECIEELQERFCCDVTDRLTGETKTVMIRLCPCRAYAYLVSILESRDEDWVSEVMEEVGLLLLVFVLKAQAEGLLFVDEDLWEDFLEKARETDVYDRALSAVREETIEDIETELVGAHYDILKRELADRVTLAPIEEIKLTLDEEDLFPTHPEPRPRRKGNVITIG